MKNQMPVQYSEITLTIKERTGVKKRKVKTWTTQEDNLLIKLHQQFPKKWTIISNLMTDRNENQCLHRYRRLSQLGSHRKIWTEDQDEKIKKFIKKVGKNWKMLSELLGTKTGKQIRERYINRLDPKIKKQQWTQEEDLRLIRLYSDIGSKWSQIAKKLPGRPENKIKNRFYSFIKRNYQIRQTIIKLNQIDQNDVSGELKIQHKIDQQTGEIDSKHSQSYVQMTTNSNASLQLQQEQEYLRPNLFNVSDNMNNVCNSKLLLFEGSEQLIREMRCREKPNSITSYENIAQNDFLIYLEGDGN